MIPIHVLLVALHGVFATSVGPLHPLNCWHTEKHGRLKKVDSNCVTRKVKYRELRDHKMSVVVKTSVVLKIRRE